MLKLGIIGGGNMGEAIIARARGKYKICVCEANAARASFLKKKYKIKTLDLEGLIGASDIILLAVKPQDIGFVLEGIAKNKIKNLLFVSIAAGITSRFIERRLGQRARVVRTMPNMPALIGEGITALSKGRFASMQDLKTAQALFNNIGPTLIVEEKWIDAVTAVSGSGPAYVFLFTECLMNAARALGFKDAQARQLVYQTLLGSAHLLEKATDDAATLRAKVTSKGGTTKAAMDVFMAHKLEKIFVDALTAAYRRAKELAK